MKDSFKDICKKIFSDYVAYLAKTDLNNIKDSLSDFWTLFCDKTVLYQNEKIRNTHDKFICS